MQSGRTRTAEMPPWPPIRQSAWCRGGVVPADAARPRVLILACGALARELGVIIDRNGLAGFDVECLPARLHSRPEQIPGAVDRHLRRVVGRYERIFVAYADCGTGGRLDEVLARYGVERLTGAHCYQFYAGTDRFQALHEEEPGTLYLTDYVVRHFDRLIWRGLGLDRHPELLEDYFGNYRRVVYLAQTENPALTAQAEAAADRLGLILEHRYVGYGELEPALVDITAPAETRVATA